MYYPGYFEMDKYAELSSEGGLRPLLWFHFSLSDSTSQGAAISVSNVNLMERVCSLTNKIYREMLCITRHESVMYITIRGLDHIQVSAFSWTPQCRIVISWDLLAWISMEGGGIPCSFTNFITTPELSGPFKLYISPDIYHTQITEYFSGKRL